MDRIDYMSLAGQQALLREQARQEIRLEASRVYAAYVALATNESFQIVLNSWMQRWLLVDITNEVAMGKHNVVVGILADLRNALSGAQGTRGLER